jgi:hypothetical protein
MNSFYSIIYISTNPIVDEKFSIGLIFVYNHQVFYKYSSEKLKIIGKLLPKNICDFAEGHLIGIGNFYNFVKTKNLKLFSELSFKELTRISLNLHDLIQISKPQQIDVENSNAFESLFTTFIFNPCKI